MPLTNKLNYDISLLLAMCLMKSWTVSTHLKLVRSIDEAALGGPQLSYHRQRAEMWRNVVRACIEVRGVTLSHCNIRTLKLCCSINCYVWPKTRVHLILWIKNQHASAQLWFIVLSSFIKSRDSSTWPTSSIVGPTAADTTLQKYFYSWHAFDTNNAIQRLRWKKNC